MSDTHIRLHYNNAFVNLHLNLRIWYPQWHFQIQKSLKISKFRNFDFFDHWFLCHATVKFCNWILTCNRNREVIESSLHLQGKHQGKDKENQKCSIIIFIVKVLLLLIIDKPILVKAWVKPRNLQILQNCRLWHKFFSSNLLQKFICLWDVHSWKSNSKVRRSSYQIQ